MTEIRYVKTYDSQGNLVDSQPYEVSDQQLLEEQLSRELNENHLLALQAYQNWSSLTPPQKDKILKLLLGFYLSAGRKLNYFNF